MKKFIKKIIIFILPVVLFFLMGVFLPTTPRASKSLLMSSVNKNLLLKNTTNPRIIFIGGSNLSFGLNSQMIKDSLQINPINTGIHFSIGIKYMIDNSLDYIQKGDIVILIPEYQHYYRSLNYTSEELFRTIFDIDLNNLKYLNFYQIIDILPFIPKYALTKFDPSEYFNIKENKVYYSIDAFNKYGDTFAHWGLKQKFLKPYDEIKSDFNHGIIKYFEEFNIAIKNKGAILLLSYPGFQEKSFNNSENQILKIEQELLNSSLKVIGSVKRYLMPDSLMFDSPYHLSKKGVDLRTNMMINDIRKIISDEITNK